MPQEDDLFSELQPGEYDGIVIPVQRVRLHTGTAAARHKFPHRAGQIIEYTGREPITGQITAAFFNGVEEGGKTVLWPDGLQLLRKRVQEQRSGPLTLPPTGRIPKAKIEIDEEYTYDAREGAYVTINFEEDSLDQFSAFSVPSARGRLIDAASTADAALNAARIRAGNLGDDPDTGNPLTNLTQLAASISGNLDRVQDDLARPVSQVNGLVNRIDEIIASVSNVLTPENWPLTNALLELRDNAAQSLEDAIKQSRPIRSYTVAGFTTVAGIASATGNTVAEILSLNSLPDANNLGPGDELLVFASGG